MSRKGVYFCLSVSLLLISVPAFAGNIQGDYVETRSADVYTGPCFANGQVNLTGQQATLGWKIREGVWNGVRLDDLAVVAVAEASATLGDPYTNPYPAKAVLIVDERATPSQRQALADFARAMGGRLLDNILAIEYVPVTLVVGEGGEHCVATLKAGNIVTVRTRALCHTDHICGNETVYYPPLVEVSHYMPAVAVTNQYAGNHLGVEWKLPEKRSAFVGAFSHQAGTSLEQSQITENQ